MTTFKDIVLGMMSFEDNKLRKKAKDAGLPWNPTAGDAPLWFLGNWRNPEEVKALIILDQPGAKNASEYEQEEYSDDPEEFFCQAVKDWESAESFLILRHAGRAMFENLHQFIMKAIFEFQRDHNNLFRRRRTA